MKTLAKKKKFQWPDPC